MSTIRERRCLGLTRNFKRCSNRGRFRLFCHHHRWQWLSLFIFLALTLIPAVLKYVDYLRPQNREIAPHAELVVGRLIEGDAYLQELKARFERQFRSRHNYTCTIRFEPPLSASTGQPAPQRFAELVRNTDIDVFLGGAVFLHRRYHASLAAITPAMLEDGPVQAPYDTSGERWIGFYSRLLGIVHDQGITLNGRPWRASSFWRLRDLAARGDTVLIPARRSTAFRDLLVDLSGERQDVRRGEEALGRYGRGMRWLGDDQRESTVLVALGKVRAAVEWVNDAVGYVARPSSAFTCVQVAIPAEARVGLSGISVRRRQVIKPEALAFIRFVISPEIQWRHFELAGRVPVDPREAVRAWNLLLASGRVTDWSGGRFLQAIVVDEDIVNEAVDELEGAQDLAMGGPLRFEGISDSLAELGCGGRPRPPRN